MLLVLVPNKLQTAIEKILQMQSTRCQQRAEQRRGERIRTINVVLNHDLAAQGIERRHRLFTGESMKESALRNRLSILDEMSPGPVEHGLLQWRQGFAEVSEFRIAHNL